MKVNRQNLTEEYRTTSNWVSEFGKSIEKSGNYLDNLKGIMKKRNDFDTIEEKMADIKNRAGFNKIEDIESADLAKKAFSCCETCSVGGSGCESCSCGKKKCRSCNKELYEKINTLIRYVIDYAKSRPESNLHAILTHCSEIPGLHMTEIESSVNYNGLKEFLSRKIDGRNKHSNKVKYIEVENDPDVSGVDIADYARHADINL